MNDHQSQKTESLEPHICGSEQRYSISDLFPSILQVTENVHFLCFSTPCLPLLLSSPVPLLSLSFPSGVGDWTQVLVHARQVLCYWATPPNYLFPDKAFPGFNFLRLYLATTADIAFLDSSTSSHFFYS